MIIFCFFIFFLSFPVFADNTSFEAVDVDGGSVRGQMVALDTQHLTLLTADSGSEEQVAVSRLDTLRNLNVNRYSDGTNYPRPATAKTAFPPNALAIDGVDGSRFVATSLNAKGTTAQARFLDGKELILPIAAIDSIRFDIKNLAELDAMPEDWRAMTSKSGHQGDRLVVGQPGALDGYDGIVLEIQPETILFSVDGETLPVPRRRVFGLVLHPPPPPAATEPKTHLAGTLALWNGSRIALRTLELSSEPANGAEKSLVWTALCGVSGTSLLREVQSVSFGRQNVLYLSDLQPEHIEQFLSFQWEIPSPAQKLVGESLTKFHAARMRWGQSRDSRSESLPVFSRIPSKDGRFPKLTNRPIPELAGIVLQGEVYRNGLTVPTGTNLVFRWNEPFSALRGIAGIDDRLRPGGRARLVILAGEQHLCDLEIRGDRPAEILKFDLPKNVRTLAIRVDFADAVAETTQLQLGEIRLIE